MTAATVTEVGNFNRGRHRFNANSAATVVNTSLDHVIDLHGIDFIFVEITVAVAALTGFAIKAQATSSAPVVALYSAAADFTSPKGILIGASGDLTVQGVGTGWFILDTRALDTLTLTATSAGSATIACNCGGE